ncbi:MAG: acyltransferase family protein [Nitriliruptoraceae bacterium]
MCTRTPPVVGEERTIQPVSALHRAADRVAARTPPDRDRYADLVRVVAILLVVLGHWLVAVVRVEDGHVMTTQLLVIEPWTRWATWVWQVMPLFFLVGGRVNAASWQRATGRGDTWWSWVRRRARRLLRPLVPLVLVWAALGPALETAGSAPRLIARAAEVAFLPLWFLVVYLLVILATPATWRLHRRAGGWAILVGVALVSIIDGLVAAGVPLVDLVNHLLVFALAHQAGFHWADDRLPAARCGPALVIGGVLAAGLLLWFGGYPVSMVGVEGPTSSNANPPNLALVALLAAQTGLLISLEEPARRWLRRAPLAWAAVAGVGAVIMPLYLWHMTALVAAASATEVAGAWPDVSPTTAAWWALRPAWVLVCGLALLPLVIATRRTTQVGEPRAGGPLMTLLGAGAAAGGLYVILEAGMYAPERLLRVPALALGLLFAGLALLGALGTPSSLSDDGQTG